MGSALLSRGINAQHRKTVHMFRWLTRAVLAPLRHFGRLQSAQDFFRLDTSGLISRGQCRPGGLKYFDSLAVSEDGALGHISESGAVGHARSDIIGVEVKGGHLEKHYGVSRPKKKAPISFEGSSFLTFKDRLRPSAPYCQLHPLHHGSGYVAKGTVFRKGKPGEIFEALGASITDAVAGARAKAEEIWRQLKAAKAANARATKKGGQISSVRAARV